MIHALEDGFMILMYSGTHDTNMSNGYVQRKHTIRLILNKGMEVMSYESLYHSGTKSRVSPSGLVKADLRKFKYLWPKIVNNQRNRTVGTTDDVAREYSEYLHRDKLDKYMCKDFYDDTCECPQCMEGETVINCTYVPKILFNQAGEPIVGDLKNGWVVIRGLTIDPDTATEINNMAIKGAGKEGVWKSIETLEKNHKMKYDINSRIPKNWVDGNLAKLLSNIKEQIFNRILTNADYMMGRHNLLKNGGIVEYDKKPHSSYPIRLLKT